MMHVTAPGLRTLVQDAGRDGYYALGLPPSGALDQRSFRIANLLVGNDPGAAVLEFVFVGPAITFERDTHVAVTGATVEIAVDGVPQPLWTRLRVLAGQTLAIGPMSKGSRGYLAVRGGVDVPLQLGSRSTYETIGFGGHEGRPLVAGDRLPMGPSADVLASDTGAPSLPEELRPPLSAHVEISVVPGLCHYRFTADSVSLFFSTTFTISHEANRTGYRLTGAPMEFESRAQPFGAGDDPSNVVNLGYPLGSIQIPSGTEPICLLRDAVTGGGYVTFGTIVSSDLDRFAQLKTPDTVTFRQVSFEDALAMRRRAQSELTQIARLLGQPPHESTVPVEGELP
ncbi:biotin-dependent carboxyltransferase family protein [Microcella alkalica]|uniref:Biotin-dependent carboxylase-like uncharacterized protein n=1 Tax=Microcella alkalica TaxID=355930 RepID=A0A839E4Q0_9MICO|nr:biotin-dependent carboxyltransferase family protein [Microcella alkalica]MBA8847351.1 biotin-dependent carboxylase-like uncharacterized protein [Microcella alkalica]